MRSSKKQMRSKFIIALFISMCSTLLCACSMGGSFFYDKDRVGNGENRELFKLSKSDNNIECSEGAAIIDLNEYSGQVVIDEPGDYLVTGEIYGSLFIDSDDGNVHLIFDGVDIASTNGPAVCVGSAGKLIITLAEGSENILSDSASYDGFEDFRACLFSAPDLTINGSGSLSVYSYAADGIRTRDILKLLGGDIYVLAKKNALRGNDGVLVSLNTMKVECEGYGIITDTNSKGDAGSVQIKAGDINMTTGKHLVMSKGDLYISLPARMKIYSVLPDFDVAGEEYIEEGAVE